jgi:predicted phosphodiesterase
VEKEKMRIAIFSDIHANFPALSAVADDAANEMGVGFRQCWSLGDVVGYGPHPAQTLAFLRDFVEPKAWVMGNHDAMLADIVLAEDLDTVPDLQKLMRVKVNKGAGREVVGRGKFMKADDWFKTTSMPVEVILRNRADLLQSPQEDTFWRKKFVPKRAKPLVLEQDGLACVLVHGSQADPLSRYVYGWEKDILIPKELKALKKLRGRSRKPIIQFYGHTHVPTFIRARESGGVFDIQAEKILPGQTFHLENNYYYMINPGSVGQPRDRDQRAAYAVFDAKARTVTFRRVGYDTTETAHDLLAGDYPESLFHRLQNAAASEKETPDEWLDHYDEARIK